MDDELEYLQLWARYDALFEQLGKAEIGGLVLAMLDYNKGIEPTLDGNERFVWPSIRRDIDLSRKAKHAEYERQKANGSKGGRPKKEKPTGFSENPKNPLVFSKTQKTQNKDKDKDKDKSKQRTPPSGGDTRAERFTPPTLAEVQSYVAERQSPVDPQEFIDFYASKGWLVGKTPMKDWKAACRNAEHWDRWTQKTKNAGSKPKPDTPEQRVKSAQALKADVDWMDAFLAENGGGG